MTTSWFEVPEIKPTAVTASYVCNNLSTHGEMIAYASIDDVVLVNTTHNSYVTHKLPCKEKSIVHQVRFCTLKDLVVIVVASDSGIQIYDFNGEESLAELMLSDILDCGVEDDSVYCQGISSIHRKEPRIIVGTSLGKLLVIEREEAVKSERKQHFEVCQILTEHDETICCVESSLDGHLLASSDLSGAILIHDPGEGFKVTHRVTSNGYLATSITFMEKNWMVVGFVTGALRLYDPDTFHVYAEVAAHTRAITALDAHNEYVVSVSEDTFMNIWEISASKNPGVGKRVNIVSSQAVPNDLLTGVAFVSKNTIVTAAYDRSHLKLWSSD